tara:strand:+ start:144 stop:905 length:762 start_codon:yes stop_codon:yes gene_type:complete
MKNITKNLKRKLLELESVEERMDSLKNKYKGKTAVILATGPTLNDHNAEEMRKIFLDRDDLVVISVKHAYSITKETTDFHVSNLWSMDRKNPTVYEDDNTIAIFNVAKSYQKEHLDIIMDNNHPCDIWFPVLNPPYVDDTQTIQATKNYDLFWMLGEKCESIWGKSIMYSSAIPLALHIGCRDIITIGWDLGTGEHFYKKEYGDVDVKYTQEAIDNTPELYDWCKNNDIDFKILSSTNPADKRFERLETIMEI